MLAIELTADHVSLIIKSIFAELLHTTSIWNKAHDMCIMAPINIIAITVLKKSTVL